MAIFFTKNKVYIYLYSITYLIYIYNLYYPEYPLRGLLAVAMMLIFEIVGVAISKS